LKKDLEKRDGEGNDWHTAQ